MRFRLIIIICAITYVISFSGCSMFTYHTLVKEPIDSLSSGEPNYNVTLDFNYQDFTSYLFMGNRVENFTAYFNTFFKSKQDYDEAFEEYRASILSYYNRRLDSLGITPSVSAGVKEKLEKAIERSSKIIQFSKESKFIDDAVLLIGKSYYLLGEYYKSERTFNEFLSKFSSSILADEALLYLGRSKEKIGKTDESKTIYKNILENSDNNEIKSLAARDMGILSYNSRNFDDAVRYFNSSIDFSSENERKAEGQFILAKILSGYKPELAAKEYKEVLEYTSDYDLTFFAKLNYAKGLVFNKNYKEAEKELESLRKKYRDDPSFTQLVDLEIANNLFAQGKIKDAQQKYFEVIVKYPNTPVSSDAYYYLAKYEEDVNNDYLKAYVNYKKSVEENNTSDFYKLSSLKASTFEKYFSLLGEVGDSSKIKIPTANADVEKFRLEYNIEKGLEQLNEQNKNQNSENNNGRENNNPEDKNTGDGKGKPGGIKNYSIEKADTLKEDNTKENTGTGPGPGPGPVKGTNKDSEKENVTSEKDSIDLIKADSLKKEEELRSKQEKEDKIFNAYYELAELFMYNLNKSDSAEYYLKLLVSKFLDSDKQEKLLYTLGYFYKNNNRNSEAEEMFKKIIANYPNSVYANEARKLLGINLTEDIISKNKIDDIFKIAVLKFNEGKYLDALDDLKGIETKFPGDTLVAKALYSIGWIYENRLIKKDSSLYYYKKLKEKFPQSVYAMKVEPLLEYMASIEPKATTDSTNQNSPPSDSLKSENPSVQPQEKSESEVKNEETNEVKSDTSNTGNENKLSQEEIDKLLKEADETTSPENK